MLFVLIVIGLLMAVFAIISVMKCRHKWLIYLCIVLLLTFLVGKLERRLRRSEH